MRTSRHRPPSFFRQGLLIVLPVVALAGAGFLSLRQDKALVQHEAREKAQAYADEIAGVLWSRLTDKTALDQFKDHTFRLDAHGQLVFPPPAPSVPIPRPLDLSSLTDEQRQLWRTAEAPAPTSRAEAVAACRTLLNARPPGPIASAIQYRLGLSLEADGKLSESRSVWQEFGKKFPDATSEAGLLLAPLVQLKLLELDAASGGRSKDAAAASLNSLCSNLVHQPTFLNPHLLGKAGEVELALDLTNTVEHWRTEWERHEALRALAAAALAQTPRAAFATSSFSSPIVSTNTPPPVPALFWFHAEDLSPSELSAFGTRPPRDAKATDGHSEANRVSFAYAGPASLELLTPVAPSPPFKRPFDTEWLASRLDDGQGGYWILCRAIGAYFPNSFSVGGETWMNLHDNLPSLPAWFDFSLEIAGETLISGRSLDAVTLVSGGKGSGLYWRKTATGSVPEILATAGRFENGVQLLKVNVHLVGPGMLFARQRTRNYLFGLLIVASVVAAMIGFVSARRAFLRQQQLGEMKSNFVSSVSHELRAPIASVRLLAESLERGKIAEPAKQNEYFRFIVQECRRLSSLIENVLDFARIEQGRKQYDFEPTEITALIRQTMKLMEPAAAEKQITLTTNLDDPQLSTLNSQLICDAGAIQQALVNLLDNAIKHSPAGETVTVTLTCSAPQPGTTTDQFSIPNSQFSISVTDHGPGIPSEEHERIFERFYRPGSEMRRETQGVGIGLSIVKHIVEAHGGRVWVESEVGHGSRFVIELPLQPNREQS